jgi:replicative DNA helicase
MADTYQRKEARDAGKVVGISTGLKKLDEKTGPLEPGQLWIIAGRPAMGKSALALQIAIAVATAGHGAAIVSLEMSRVELAKRQLSANSAVHSDKIRDGRVNDYDLEALAGAYEWLRGLPVWIQDDTSSSIGLLKAKLKRLKTTAERRGNPLKLVVVDYLQLIEGQKGLPREQAVAMVSRSLKAIAMDLELTVVGVSQLNRGCEDRKDKHPIMSDLRESGAIEQDADVVIFLHKPHLKDDEEERFENAREVWMAKERRRLGLPDHAAINAPYVTEAFVAKNRYGPSSTGSLLCFHGGSTRYEDYFEWLKELKLKDYAAGEKASRDDAGEPGEEIL